MDRFETDTFERVTNINIDHSPKLFLGLFSLIWRASSNTNAKSVSCFSSSTVRISLIQIFAFLFIYPLLGKKTHENSLTLRKIQLHVFSSNKVISFVMFKNINNTVYIIYHAVFSNTINFREFMRIWIFHIKTSNFRSFNQQLSLKHSKSISEYCLSFITYMQFYLAADALVIFSYRRLCFS